MTIVQLVLGALVYLVVGAFFIGFLAGAMDDEGLFDSNSRIGELITSVALWWVVVIAFGLLAVVRLGAWMGKKIGWAE